MVYTTAVYNSCFVESWWRNNTRCTHWGCSPLFILSMPHLNCGASSVWPMPRRLVAPPGHTHGLAWWFPCRRERHLPVRHYLPHCCTVVVSTAVGRSEEYFCSIPMKFNPRPMILSYCCCRRCGSDLEKVPTFFRIACCSLKRYIRLVEKILVGM